MPNYKINGIRNIYIVCPFNSISDLFTRNVFFNDLDKKFTQLNPQIWSNSFLNKKGKTSVKRIVKVHGTVFQSELFKSGELRDHDVEIMANAPNPDEKYIESGTKEVSKEQKITNLYSKADVKSALKGVVKMWNKWAAQKNQLDHKSKIDLVSRFHTYFEIIHPFLVRSSNMMLIYSI